MYWKIIADLAILSAAGYFAWQYRNQIRESVAAWLRQHGLQDSALMKAWIVFDRLISRVRRYLKVETRQTSTQKISETTHSLEEIRETDPDVYDQLQRLNSPKRTLCLYCNSRKQICQQIGPESINLTNLINLKVSINLTNLINLRLM